MNGLLIADIGIGLLTGGILSVVAGLPLWAAYEMGWRWCRLGLHEWIDATGTVATRHEDRACLRCGKVQLRGQMRAAAVRRIEAARAGETGVPGALSLPATTTETEVQ